MIYLVKNSPHNEDFILLGYAVDLRGIKQIVLDYYRWAYGVNCQQPIIVDYATNEVRIKASETWDSNTVLYLVPIPQIEVL
jgi:hypothetical protein